MKKIILSIGFVLLGFANVNAQFGITVGYHNLNPTVTSNTGTTLTDQSGSGFYIGLFNEYKVSEKFSVQPEVQLTSVTSNGVNLTEIALPIMAKFYVIENLNLQVGPQFDVFTKSDANYKAFGFSLGLGAGYDFSENLFITTRYSLGLNNRLKTPTTQVTAVKYNFFQVGIGYKF